MAIFTFSGSLENTDRDKLFKELGIDAPQRTPDPSTPATSPTVPASPSAPQSSGPFSWQFNFAGSSGELITGSGTESGWSGLYTMAGGMLGMHKEQVDWTLAQAGLGPDVQSTFHERRQALVEASMQRGGGKLIQPWHGDVSPATAWTSTVAQHQMLAQGQHYENLSPELQGMYLSDQRAADINVLTSVPGITLTPEGNIYTGALKESKLAKATRLGFQ